MWGSFPVLELTLGVWPCPQGLQAGAQGKREGEGKGNKPYNGGPRLGSGAGERVGGTGDTGWAEDLVCFSTLALLPSPPPGDPAGVVGVVSGAEDVPGVVGVYGGPGAGHALSLTRCPGPAPTQEGCRAKEGR